MGAEEIRSLIRRYPWGAKILDAFGGFPLVAQFIFGLSLVTAIMGFFSQYPYVGMACAAIFAYYATQAWLVFREWWERDTLDHKLSYSGAICSFNKNDDGTFDVVPNFVIRNLAAFDIVYKPDSETFRIGDRQAAVDAHESPVQIIPARSYFGFAGNPICGVKVSQNDRIVIDICARYGKDRKRLHRRWFVKCENHLPPELSGTAHTNPSAWTLLRNDVETVLD
jgi:hypothetical protein